jgi:hypothetical protein
MTVPTRTPTFTPPGQFSWTKAAGKSLGLHAIAIGVLALAVLLSGLGYVTTRSDSPVEAGYTLLAWTAVQGCYPLYHRATGAPDDYIPQSPRFLRLLLMSQAIGLVLLALVARPLATLFPEQHPVGSLPALLPDSGSAFALYLLYAVGMVAWPSAALLFMLRSTARPGTLLVGVLVGLPVFILTLPGGLVAGGLRLLAERIDLDREMTIWGTYGVSGLVVYTAVLIWFARSVGHEPLGPPPAKRNMFGAAVASR